jgi:hypothetical protein
MKLPTLPSYPHPAGDEALSSWVERIGIFYGCHFDHWLGPVATQLGTPQSATTTDVDSDPRCRSLFIEWTGLPPAVVPPILKGARRDLLPPLARLAFCPACWDADVDAGHQPYIRREWSHWSCVCCVRHQTFLASRATVLDPFRRVLAWLPIWRTNMSWIAPFQQSHDDSPYGEAAWYTPGRSTIWSGSQWSRLLSQFARIAAVDAEATAPSQHPDLNAQQALRLAQSMGFRSVAREVCELVTTAGKKLALRLTENDIRRHNEALPDPPLLLETRIAMMVMAAEILCIRDRNDPIHEDIARAIRMSSQHRLARGKSVVRGPGATARLNIDEISPQTKFIGARSSQH